jgi:class 3 adenylate cyclase
MRLARPQDARDDRRVSAAVPSPEPPARAAAWAAVAALPLAGLVLLLAAPETDVRWEHHPAHFWLVLASAAASTVLAYATGDVGRRRGDARLVLLSLAFLASASFLGLHALATPGVLLEQRNAGFVLATPAGLLLAAILAALSATRAAEAHAAAIVRRAGALRAAVLGLALAWGAVSLARAGPLEDPTPPESGTAALTVPATLGLALYGFAAWRYAGLHRRLRAPIVLAVVCALALLAEAMIAVAFSRTWQASWWEWHLLLLGAYALIADAARRQGPAERFSDLYLDSTARGAREISVLFADLAGFTSFSDGRDPREVSAMLNATFARAIPALRAEGGEVDRLVGDAVLATFGARGDQPDHPRRAARAALALLRAGEGAAAGHPDWPRFRVGVNTGTAMVGVVGAGEGTTYTVIGDTVNVAARLQATAPVGEAVVGGPTLRALPGARARSLGAVAVKGKREPVDAWVLEGLPEG